MSALNTRFGLLRSRGTVDRYLPWCRMSDPAVIPVECVSTLSSLGTQLITPGDVPAMLELLDAPQGAERQAVIRGRAYVRARDLDARIARLEQDPV